MTYCGFRRAGEDNHSAAELPECSDRANLRLMDVLEIIRNAVKALPEGEHSLGLQSVIRHIDAAVAHLARGQQTLDDGAFTDAIYRTNQAFEGSVKEAYRVLAGKDPSRLKPSTIESYLEKDQHLRERVLIQLRRYRQEWRNPSTHDYNLDFNEDEAFLAIVSVSAFAKVLIDQMAERLAFDEAATAQASSLPDNVQRFSIPQLLATFARTLSQAAPEGSRNESQIVGGLAGFMSQVPGIRVIAEPTIRIGTRQLRPDLHLNDEGEQWIVELKQYRSGQPIDSELSQLMTYLSVTDAAQGALLLLEPRAKDYVTREIIETSAETITIIAPKVVKRDLQAV